MHPFCDARVYKILVVCLLVSTLEMESQPAQPAQAAPAFQMVQALPARLAPGAPTHRALPDGMLDTPPAVGIGGAWVTGFLGTAQIIFKVGDQINFTGWFYNDSSQTQKAAVIWEVNGPCGSMYSDDGDYLITHPGYMLSYTTWVAADACSGRYTLFISVTYQGATTSQTLPFVILNPTHLSGAVSFLPVMRK